MAVGEALSRGVGWLLGRVDRRVLLMLFGLVVGTCSGLASVALTRSIVAMEGLLHYWATHWWFFLAPGLGAAASALFLHRVVREDAGHGVPEVIYSVSRLGGRLRFRSSFSRLISSCLTIGTGGSAGPEAPVVISGSAIGSSIATAFDLTERDRVVLVGCGAAGAIGAIFNAPIAGIVFSLEVILGEWSRVSIAPIAIAGVAGTEISRVLQGNQIPFSHEPFQIAQTDIIASIGLAVLAAVVAVAFTRLLRAAHSSWNRLPVPSWVRAAAGGFVVGAIGLAMPVVLGEGYAAIRQMIGGVYSSGALLVALAVAAKVFATSMTLGSGGSGGIFAPSLLIGSLLGLGYQRGLSAIWPATELVHEGCFALLGMAGLISGMLQAPLTGIFLIIEITGGYEVILPLILVSVISSSLSHRLEPGSFYLRDLQMHGHLLRPGTDRRVLADLRVGELIERDCEVIPESMRLGELVKLITQTHRNYFAVVDPRSGGFRGLVHLDAIRPYLFSTELHNALIVGEIMDSEATVVSPDADLNDVLQRMDDVGAFSLPVVEEGRFLGMVSKATLLDRYRRELIVQTAQ